MMTKELYKKDVCQRSDLDKETIIIDYIKSFSENKNINLEPSELKNILDFLLAAIDPLLEYKINEILKYRENIK